MTLYELFLFVHVFAAAAWIGAIVFLVLIAELALRANDTSILLRLIDYDEKLTPILYIPAVILVLGAGIGLVLEGPWSFGDSWVIAGIVLLAATVVLGAGFIGAAAKKVRAAAEAAGVDSVEVRARLQTLRALSWLDAVLLALVVWVMTTKP